MHWDPGTYWDWAHYFDLLGAPIHSSRGNKDSENSDNENKDSGVVTIAVNFQTNTPPTTYGSQQLEPQPSNFVYLRTAPSFDAPLISDPALHPDGSPGTTAANDWGDKAVIGQSFYQADRQGDWTAIFYGGKKAWFYNPHDKNSVPGSGVLVTPKAGLDSIPVYGAAFPEDSAYERAGIPKRINYTLQYRIPAGQVYVSSTGPIQSDYYFAKLFNAPSTYKVVKGDDEYYQISFNHRNAFVKKSDVDIIDNSRQK
jgi:hypothetical protein